MLRDASQLTGSVTKDLGGNDARGAPQFTAVRHHGSADLQPGNAPRFHGRGSVPVAGRRVLPAVRPQVRAEPADPGLRRHSPADSIAATARTSMRRPIRRSISDLSYDFKQFAVFGEATYRFSPQWALTAGLRYYDFSEDRLLTFAGLLRRPGLHQPAGFDELRRLLAARDPGLQPQQERAVHGAGLARLPPRRHQRSAQRRPVLA